MDRLAPGNEELIRFRTEAAALLGVTRPKPAETPPPRAVLSPTTPSPK